MLHLDRQLKQITERRKDACIQKEDREKNCFGEYSGPLVVFLPVSELLRSLCIEILWAVPDMGGSGLHAPLPQSVNQRSITPGGEAPTTFCLVHYCREVVLDATWGKHRKHLLAMFCIAIRGQSFAIRLRSSQGKRTSVHSLKLSHLFIRMSSVYPE